MTEKEVRKF